MPDPRSPDDPKPIAEAASLFDTDEIRPIQVPAPVEPSATTDGYELEAGSISESHEPVRPVVLPEPVARSRSTPRPKPRTEPTEPVEEVAGSSEFDTEVSRVDPIWTRGAEWGPDLIKVMIAGFSTLFLTYLFSGWFLFAVLIFLVGGAVTVLLSYPILVTLERPVRITPEQAVLDFFAAASHHFPHYRRMWLLLSTDGRDSSSFHGFEDFRDHWQRRIKGWRSSRGAHMFAPLTFEVGDFQSDKSTGKLTSKADYTVRVALRDQAEADPIASFRMIHGLVKGSDRMWYLNRGVLPN